jgi:hypothetical protein
MAYTMDLLPRDSWLNLLPRGLLRLYSLAAFVTCLILEKNKVVGPLTFWSRASALACEPERARSAAMLSKEFAMHSIDTGALSLSLGDFTLPSGADVSMERMVHGRPQTP